MIKVENLTKRYGSHTAVKNISFSIEKGEIIGFLGPNGAGKSTTMNILTGYLSATEGEVEIAGKKILEDPIECKKHIGYLPENPPLYMTFTVREYLNFVADLKGIEKAHKKEHIDTIAEKVGITHVINRLIKNLSKGYKQRVGLAQALIGDPDILILDEPTIGLDPRQILDIRSLIKDLGKNHTVILSSHILPEVSMVCKRILIINNGTLIADDSPDKLATRLTGSNKLFMRLEAKRDDIEKAFSELADIKELNFKESQEENTVDVEIIANEDTDIRKPLFYACAQKDIPILTMRTLDVNLEDIFLHLITEEKQDKEA